MIRFLKGEKIPPGIADTLLVLVLKINMSDNIKQFHPINLCNVMFKMVMKMMINRLLEVMDDLVSPN